MPDLIQLEEQLLTHHLQSTDFSGIFLRRQIDLSIASLTHLGKYLEISMPESSPSFTQIGSLPSQVFMLRNVVLLLISCRRKRILLTENCLTVLAVMNVIEEVEIVIQKV